MISTKIQIRFGDCDMGGHVHNAAYLHYFESARVNFFVSELGTNWDWGANGLILKKNIVEYQHPVHIEDDLKVEVRTTHIGTKSFTLSYAVINGNGLLMTSGESVVVCFDYTHNHSIEIPRKMKALLLRHLED